MEDIKAIDIMNYPAEAGFEEYLFKWDEFKTMAKGSFKSLFGGRVPSEEEYKELKKSGVFMPGHTSPEELIKDMDEVGYEYVVISGVKMWSYYSHHQLIMDYDIDIINDMVQRGKGRIIGGASYNPFRIDNSLRDIEKAVKACALN